MSNLFVHSVRTILTHQAPTGAYVACPNFPTYCYSWFRDGAFIAYAMNLAGQHDSAHRFHDWVVRAIRLREDQVERAIARVRRGEPLGEDYLHTRYTLSGEAGSEEWTNFQLDGLGTWLWALAEHQRHTGTLLSSEWQTAVELLARYLIALWAHPCYDLWEEHPHLLHPYTLAAIAGGLQAAGHFLPSHSPQLAAAAADIRHFMLTNGVRHGHLVKSIIPPSADPIHPSLHPSSADPSPGDAPSADPIRSSVYPLSDPLTPSVHSLSGDAPSVDASLVGVATPYRLLPPDDPIMRATVARIEADLHCPGGGIHRYRADTYYGGGEWILLAAWLGWYYTEVGALEQARELRRWVEAQADARGDLPEQVSTHLLAPGYYAEWEARWGQVAKPLLWSHAMYLILRHALDTKDH